MIGAYYRLQCLPDEVKAANKIKSKVRLDCTAYSDKVQGSYGGMKPFINAKGHMALYKQSARDIVEASSRRIAEWVLSNGVLNLSSIYQEDLDFPEFGFGYPNANRILGNGQPNPLFPYSNDGYLFVMNKDLSQIELFVIPDGRNLITSYYHKLIDCGFDEEMKQLREQSKPYFNYIGLGL